MAYDEVLAGRLRGALSGEAGLDERPMFGGLAFLVGGHMAISASAGGGLLVRCPPEDTDRLLALAGTAPMEMRGREMRGWLRVAADAVGTDEALDGWVAIGVAHARSLPPRS